MKTEDRLHADKNSRPPGKDPNRWYRVPEAWLVLILLVGSVIVSLALVATALEHRDDLVISSTPIATPLPPSHAQRPADDATP
jgi:hypothetical protein